MRRFLAPLFLFFTITPVLTWVDLARAVDQPAAESPEEIQFFEQKIRPVLVQHCYECHSEAAFKAKRLKGGLYVDSQAGLLRGGDSGPALVPMRSDQSLLLQALRYDSVQMPPKGKLPDQIIADFERWITQGAVDPRRENTPAPRGKTLDLDEARKHWSYRPLSAAQAPRVAETLTGARSPLDAFILARLQIRSIAPASEADPTTLVRRLYFDLIGLPPTLEEIDEFLDDEAPDAYERLVDRLLASPHFGIRWGRQWLSVARFAESLTLRGLVFPDAWRYRDYVINAFNTDLPFDQFVHEQLAGDLLPADNLDQRQRRRIATTFLMLGNHNLEEQDKQQLRMDVVDEQLDAIGKGLLAQTIGCARCHDHKFDPIPTRDYYALAGILANVKSLKDENVSKWLEFPLPLDPVRETQFAAQEATIAALQQRIKTVEEQKKPVERKIVMATDLPGIIVDDRQATVVGDWRPSQVEKPYINAGYLHDAADGKGEKTITLQTELQKSGQYEVRLAYTSGNNRSEAVPVTVFSADGEKTVVIDQKRRPPIDNLFVSLGLFRFEAGGQCYVMIDTMGTSGHVIVDAVQFLPMDAMATDSPTDKTVASALANENGRNSTEQLDRELKSLSQQLKQLQKDAPQRPKYMSVEEQSKAIDLRVHIRGTVHNLGESVPRGFLQVLATNDARPIPASQSGRRELGEWITSRQNPLTSRVITNRLWHWLFGAGLSRTPDNFGVTGDEPSHPELLDYLALRLLERDWQLKPMIREIATSRTYRQSSRATPAQRTSDPENRTLSHAHRRRLDAECLLDSILLVSGQLQDQLGGSGISSRTVDDYGYQHDSRRRAVYWPVFRNSLPDIFEAFDFADPSLPSGSRNVSTVAPQSLFFLNHPWINANARFTARRLLNESHGEPAERTRWLFRSILGRLPTDNERQIADRSLAREAVTEEAWTMVVQAMFASIDFRYVE